MSIERQLAEAFKQDAKDRRRPPSLDSRIATEYRQQVRVLKGEAHMGKKWKMPKAALIALIVVIILSGFAFAGSKLLFTDEKGGYSITVRSHDDLKLDSEALEKVRFSLKEIRSQLEPGESAVVYASAFDLPGGGGWLSAYQPVIITELEQWKSKLTELNVDENLPASLPGSFEFEEGIEGEPFTAFLDLDDLKIWDEMKAESKKTGSELLWRKTDVADIQPTSTYTSIFRNASEDSIYLSWEIMNEPDLKSMAMSPSGNEYEELQWDGLKAHYTKTMQWLYGNSNVYQDIMWIQESDGKTIVYRVGSDSPQLSKEQLIEIAKDLS